MPNMIMQTNGIPEKLIIETIKRNIRNPEPFNLGRSKIQLRRDETAYLKLLCSDEDLLYKIYRYVELIAKENNLVNSRILESDYVIKYLFSSDDFKDYAMHVCEWNENPKQRENELDRDSRCENIERIYQQKNEIYTATRNYQKLKQRRG